jgi:hypothetical protein
MIALALATYRPAYAQQDRGSFRNPRRAERLAATRAALDSTERDSRALRTAIVDSALGTPTWLGFSADQAAAERRAGTVDGVLAAFLARHRQVLGLEEGVELREVERETDADMVHLRFRQFWRRFPVSDGELRLHLRQAGGGYVVETANGRVYTDIDAPETPSITPAAAAAIAAAQLGGAARVDSGPDGPLAILPYGEGYRLVYSASEMRRAATVDARSGEILETKPVRETFTRSGPASSARAARLSRAPKRHRPAGSLPVGYVPGSGFDAFGLSRSGFLVYQTSANFEMRSNQLGAWVSEVVVRDYGGASLEIQCSGYPPYVPAFPLATHTSQVWPQGLPAPAQQVSAMVNGLSTGVFFRDSLARRSYDEALPGSPIVTCVNGVELTNLGEEIFQAASFSDYSLGFVRQGGYYLGSASTQDVVTHEFTHNVTRFEDVAQAGVYQTAAVKEALSDYFGARHRRNPRMGDGAISVAYARDLTTLKHFNDSLYLGQPNAHIWGLAVSGALWGVASLSNALGKDVDQAAYRGIRYYVITGAKMADTREAIVRAAQDRQQ